MAALVAAAILAACSEPEPSKPSFMERTGGIRQRSAEPEGLNPLGAVDVCRPGAPAQPLAAQVLVSRPERFSREASLMLSALHQALADDTGDGRRVRFLVTAQPVLGPDDAREEGRRCGAMVVLWERYGSRTLELTLPYPARIPLRASLHSRLCEFGTYQDQLEILYLTLMGLVAMLDNNYDQAVYHLDQAKRLDSRCLHVPGMTD